MIIEVDINTLEVSINGNKVGTTTTEKMHKCRDYARTKCDQKGSTYYTILDNKIASQHDIPDDVAITIMYALLETETPLMRIAKEGDPIANFLLRG